MQIAVIAPTKLLSEYATTGYHLVLCHKILMDDRYTQFYAQRSAVGDFIILDNSAHELNVGESGETMMEAASIIHPSEVVLPDRLFMGEDTMRSGAREYARFRSLAPRVMGVPQGSWDQEWYECCEFLIRLGIDTIGISKDYERWPGGLLSLVRGTRDLNSQLHRSGLSNLSAIHLLGWGRQVTDLDSLGLESLVPHAVPIRGIDSGKPLVYAHYGIRMKASATLEYPRRPAEFFDLDESEIDHDAALHNIGLFATLARVPSAM